MPISQGENVRYIEFNVKLFGYSPAEALQCATRVGGAVMGLEVGCIREGWLADLLLVEGDPLADVRVLHDARHLRLIVQDGGIHKDTLSPATTGAAP